MKQIKITKLKPEQWKLYKRIRLQAVKKVPIAFAETEEQVMTHQVSYWQDALASLHQLWLFALDKGIPVAMMGAYLNDNVQEKEYASIVSVYVDTPYRGKGLGKFLLQTFLKEIDKNNKIKKIKVWVTETQKPAISLYQSCGFTYLGANKHEVLFEGKYFDELIMEKNI